jgi:hypothetical protein
VPADRPTDRPTRFAVDLLESAAVEGKRESRSAKQQLDHWARVGRAVSMHETAARRRVEAALAGTLPLSQLDDDERLVANVELDVAIQNRADSASFGDRLAAEGVTTVALAEDGTLVEHRPDGPRTVIAAPSE